MSSNPLLSLLGDGKQSLKVAKTEGCAVAVCAGLILERPREGRCGERSFFTDILPDGGLHVAASDRAEKGISC